MAKLKKQGDYYRAWYKGKRFQGKTIEEAKAKRDAYKYECEHGIEQQKPIKVFDLVEQWLPVAKANVSKTTYNQYVCTMEKMLAVIGDKNVSAVTPGDIKKIWASFVGKSQHSISKGVFLYTAFFKYAIENGYCKQNPLTVSSAKPHRGKKGTHRALESWEKKLIETTPHRCQAAAMFMMIAGLRRGEVLALKKNDIRNDKIYVTKAVNFVNNRPVVGCTKNESSERIIPLFEPLKPFVKQIDNYILQTSNGEICSKAAFDKAWESYMTELSTAHNGISKRWYHLTREWKQSHPDEYQKYLKLKEEGKNDEAEAYRLTGWIDVSIRPHDLRHTFVTTCCDHDVNAKVCMRWCGHSSERMIMQIYDHVSEDREQASILKLYPKQPKNSHFDNAQT